MPPDLKLHAAPGGTAGERRHKPSSAGARLAKPKDHLVSPGGCATQLRRSVLFAWCAPAICASSGQSRCMGPMQGAVAQTTGSGVPQRTAYQAYIATPQPASRPAHPLQFGCVPLTVRPGLRPGSRSPAAARLLRALGRSTQPPELLPPLPPAAAAAAPSRAWLLQRCGASRLCSSVSCCMCSLAL